MPTKLKVLNCFFFAFVKYDFFRMWQVVLRLHRLLQLRVLQICSISKFRTSLHNNQTKIKVNKLLAVLYKGGIEHNCNALYCLNYVGGFIILKNIMHFKFREDIWIYVEFLLMYEICYFSF